MPKLNKLVERRDVLAGVQVDAGQPQDRLGDHPDPRLDRRDRAAHPGRGRRGRPRCSGPAPPRDNPSPGRRCPTRPSATGRAGPASARPGSGTPAPSPRSSSRACEPDRVLAHLPDPEHPPVPPAAPDRPPDLIGQRLVRHPLVSLRQRAGHRPVRSPRFRIAARNAAIACSNRRSIRSVNPSNGITPLAGRSGASWIR